ncbi:MAG: hypothetical protein KDA24_24725 [Deltaproteobacteria bacterium]|nr:hypothetical protein [Deltaproteobacteria bacterium]
MSLLPPWADEHDEIVIVSTVAQAIANDGTELYHTGGRIGATEVRADTFDAFDTPGNLVGLQSQASDTFNVYSTRSRRNAPISVTLSANVIHPTSMRLDLGTGIRFEAMAGPTDLTLYFLLRRKGAPPRSRR